jgi:hypothetical protein
MARPKRSIQERVQKELPEFAEVVAGLSVAELEQRLATEAKNSERIEESKENDQALEDAKAQVAELGAPYRDAKKVVRLKSRYLISLIKEKGGDA